MATEKNLQAAFDLLCTTSGAKDGKLSLESIKKWFKQSAVTGQETGITDTEVQVAFEKSAKDKKEVTFTELKDCIVNIAKEKNVDPNDIMYRLASAALPKMGQETCSGPDTDQKIGKGTM